MEFERKVDPVRVEPDSWYDNDDLGRMFLVSDQALAKARRAGALRFTTAGHRNLYLGRWVTDWLVAGARLAAQDKE